jgi:hypothetical protein
MYSSKLTAPRRFHCVWGTEMTEEEFAYEPFLRWDTSFVGLDTRILVSTLVPSDLNCKSHSEDLRMAWYGSAIRDTKSLAAAAAAGKTSFSMVDKGGSGVKVDRHASTTGRR